MAPRNTSKGKKEKKVKTEAESDKPKRPVTIYLKWRNVEYPKLKSKNSTWTHDDINKELTKLWEKADKSKYEKDF